MAADDRSDQTEVRFWASNDLVGVLDALVIATGTDRATIMRGLVREMVEKEIHRATVVLRVARINPLAVETDGKAGGSGKSET